MCTAAVSTGVSIMLGIIARWGHNVLLAAMALMTVAVVVLVA
jgi:hypothetical protein